jgi:hypothetical protein
MGFRYLIFRLSHISAIKLGIFRKKFPVNPPSIKTISLTDWKQNLPPFLIYGKNPLKLIKQKSVTLENIYKDFTTGTVTFFGKSRFELGKDFDWLYNPVSGFRYDINQHWSLISDLSEEAGDIKFVWERARFSFLYDIIRYDYHYQEDCAGLVFSEISSFIKKNPLNQGPNYICSQEISLRIMNWTYALYYYKDSKLLTENLFTTIMNSIYWQINHIYHNINFSRIAVRNNHAITETLLLYLSGLLFPFLPDVNKWSKKGKKWFEEEIAYQIYTDGTYLQFSNNYHRVVTQLLTWACRLSELNNDKFSPVVYMRARKSLDFLYNSMDLYSGYLPNYGSNDGALFFKFNDHDFRDFRPQLQALSYALDQTDVLDLKNYKSEDLSWFGFAANDSDLNLISQKDGVFLYPVGGFYTIRDNDSMTYIRCGNHKDRPAHADNLHLDIWYKGINYFRDNGSFLYNADPVSLRFFMGTKSHNTVMLDDFDQMLKGPRFIWFYWSQAIKADVIESNDRYEFNGSISAYKYLGNNIKHKRQVIKIKESAKWIIRDEIDGWIKGSMHQLWHFNPEVEPHIIIKAEDNNGNPINQYSMEGWYSSYYGVKEKTKYWKYSTDTGNITTTIEIIK